MTQKQYIIIGSSAAGIAAVRTLRQLDQDARIICASDESEQPYNKCFLADYLAGHKRYDQTYTLTQEQAAQLRITMKLGMRVVAINAQERFITYADGSTDTYDKLLLATGRTPRQHPLLQVHYTNLFPFYTLRYAQQLFTHIQEHKPKTALVIGGGLSGVEVADALVRHGIKVHIVEQSAQLLTHLLSTQGSEVLAQLMQQQGVQVQTNAHIVSVQVDAQINQVVFADGTIIRPDVVISAIGAVVNDELVKQARLAQDAYGISVNQFMNTSNEHIYAAGDMISIVDQLSSHQMTSCTWPDAIQQGRYAAMAMAGQPKAYPGAAVIASSAFFGVAFYSCGLKELSEGEIIERSDAYAYVKLILTQEGLLKGFMLLGKGKSFPVLKQALLTKTPVKHENFNF